MSLFKPGKITFVLDGGAGSSSKALRGANLWKYYKATHTTCAANTFMENAAHTVTHPDGREYIHQCLSSITSLESYQKQYVGPGCVFAAKTMLDEIAQHHITPDKLGIHPNAVIVTEKDVNYERGTCDFEGNPKDVQESINLRIGSTLHGVGAARARRVLRRPDVVLAKDIPELAPFICQTHREMMKRLTRGESILGEIAQGYQLGLMGEYYPRCTSRSCSVAAFLDDSLLPPAIAGPVIVNFRTFPIRVNSNKYVRKSDKKILTWSEFESTPEADREIIKGDSGGCYSDQQELTWDEISERAGKRIFEQTSLTKLPRRVFSFSHDNMMEALEYNDTGDDQYISINFLNYVDASVEGKRYPNDVLTPKIVAWLKTNVLSTRLPSSVKGLFLSTWKTIDDSCCISRHHIL